MIALFSNQTEMPNVLPDVVVMVGRVTPCAPLSGRRQRRAGD